MKPLLPFYYIKTTTTASFLRQDFSMLLLLLAFSMPSKLHMASKVEAFALAIVKALVSCLEEKMPSYKKNYSETQTRIDFVDPFFEALGWDINNKKGFSEAYRDVIHEDKIKIGKANKAPDYSFRFQGNIRYILLKSNIKSIHLWTSKMK